MHFTTLLAVGSLLPLCVFASDLSAILSKLSLSPDARIHFPNQPLYDELTKRWQYWSAPDFSAVIEVATASDIVETIRFANSRDIPYLAQTGGHGGTASFGNFKNGIQINLRKLNSVVVSSDGTYATLGGGVKGVEVRDTLWKQDKWTAHGACDCVGFAALALGGGHGMLQGRFGLMSDQVLSMDVVLANGSSITTSKSEHSDLFWAMQGAGHNFGVVTSMEYKVYDLPDTEVGGRVWSYEMLVYAATPENVKSVFGAAKDLMGEGSQPEELTLYGVIALDPASGMPVILQHLIHNAPLSHLQPYTAPFHALSPIASKSDEGTFLDVPHWMDMAANSPACDTSRVIPKPGIVRVPVDVKTYNLDALAGMVEEFTLFAMNNSEFAGSFALVEQYATHAVRAKDASDSAVPWREQELLIAPMLFYPTNADDGRLDDLAWRTAGKLRDILVDGAKDTGGHYSYVNYAYGGEPVEDIYGKNILARLRRLKEQYDPENIFRWSVPIVEQGKDVKSGYRDEL